VKLGLINSAWLGTPIDTSRGIELTRQIGFDTIDIFADPLEIGARARRAIRKSCESQQLPVVSVVCCALGIADFNQSVRAFHVARAKVHLDLGYEIEAKNLLLVLGEYIWQQEVIAPKDQWKWAVEQVQQLAEYADALDLEVAIELEPFHLSIVNNIEHMTKFLDEVNHPRVKANVDISHLALAGDGAEEIKRLAGRIAHVHLSDCDGKRHGDLPPGRGCVDFPPYLQALSDSGFNGTVSIELEYSPEPNKIVEWVTEAYASTDQMMKALGIRG
jgi:D-psicose/D-tagatose/L-ribulose 3-epimerase